MLGGAVARRGPKRTGRHGGGPDRAAAQVRGRCTDTLSGNYSDSDSHGPLSDEFEITPGKDANHSLDTLDTQPGIDSDADPLDPLGLLPADPFGLLPADPLEHLPSTDTLPADPTEAGEVQAHCATSQPCHYSDPGTLGSLPDATPEPEIMLGQEPTAAAEEKAVLSTAALRACRLFHEAYATGDSVKAQHAFARLAKALRLRDVHSDVTRRTLQDILTRHGARSGASAS